jgi:ribose/xylose/arabinose/galactoside ABC-type transport system permease subunit
VSSAATPSAGRRWKVFGQGATSINPGLVAALVVIFVALSFLSPFFFTLDNVLNIAKAVVVVGIASAGESIVIISGGFDLSVGSTMAAAGMLAAWMLESGSPIPLAFAAAIALGVLVGIANGTIISYFHINPLITTLGMLAIVRGLAFVISGGREIVITDRAWLDLGTAELLGIPLIVLIALGTFLVIGWSMPRTLFGRYVYAIGSNIRAARLSGIAVDRWRLLFYVACGATAALAGLVLTARVGSARPAAAATFELDVITAVILGGASLSGGRGTVWGTLVGLLLIGVINNGMTLAQIPAFWQQVVKGAILLSAVLYDEARRHRRDDT